MFQYKPTENVSMAKGGLRNMLDGSKAVSISHLNQESNFIEETLAESYGDSNVERYSEYRDWLVSKAGSSDFGLVLYDQNHYILKHRSEADIDTVVINSDRTVYLYSSSGRLVHRITLPREFNLDFTSSVYDLLEHIASFSSFKVGITESQVMQTYFMLTAIDKSGMIYSFGEAEDGDHDSHYRLTGLQETPSITEVKQNVVSNSNQSGEVKMANNTNKVTAIVTANKTAAQNAAKIEAGTIAINKLANLLAPKMPFGTSGYLKTPLGKVVLANVVNFAIQQYAANNPKAKVIGEAVMDAAALELVQSFNVGAMIDDLIGSVNLTGLVPEEENGLEKYRTVE